MGVAAGLEVEILGFSGVDGSLYYPQAADVAVPAHSVIGLAHAVCPDLLNGSEPSCG